MFSEKEENYIKLVKDMKECRLCRGIKAPSYCEEEEYLLNDSHGIISGQKTDIDQIYVNRWNMWQGSLDAEIMVAGLDFGRVTVGSIDQPERHRWWEDESSAWKSPTDKNLNRIFHEVFGDEFNLTKPCDKFFLPMLPVVTGKKGHQVLQVKRGMYFVQRNTLGDSYRLLNQN